MSIKPILFNSEMVQAIMDGRKNVTRRLIKPQPTYSPCDGFTWKGAAYGTDIPPTIKGDAYNLRCAVPYQPGDILYVRETWSPVFVKPRRYLYKVGCKEAENLPIKWHPSIHMPKEAARIFLKVKGVQVERLQCMSWDDMCNEGIIPDSDIRDNFSFEMLQNKFKNLWNSTIKKSDLDRYGWDANPWVWVIEFERCEKPEGW